MLEREWRLRLEGMRHSVRMGVVVRIGRFSFFSVGVVIEKLIVSW